MQPQSSLLTTMVGGPKRIWDHRMSFGGPREDKKYFRVIKLYPDLMWQEKNNFINTGMYTSTCSTSSAQDSEFSKSKISPIPWRAGRQVHWASQIQSGAPSQQSHLIQSSHFLPSLHIKACLYPYSSGWLCSCCQGAQQSMVPELLSNNVANYVENINQYMTILFDSVGSKAQSPGIQRQIGHQKTF